MSSQDETRLPYMREACQEFQLASSSSHGNVEVVLFVFGGFCVNWAVVQSRVEGCWLVELNFGDCWLLTRVEGFSLNPGICFGFGLDLTFVVDYW